MKRFLSLFFIFLLVLSLPVSLFSCDREYDAEFVKAEAKILIEKSLVLNDIYWGEGIPYFKNTSTEVYCEANFLALSELGFYTVEELKQKTLEVFSTDYSNSIFKTAFSSINDGEEIRFYARYYQKYEDAEMTIPVTIMVYSKFKNMLPDKIEYLYDTIEVTHSDGDIVFVKLNVKITTEDGKTQIREKVIGLVEEDAGWRIETSTYITYNEKQDEYEDLKQNKNK